MIGMHIVMFHLIGSVKLCLNRACITGLLEQGWSSSGANSFASSYDELCSLLKLEVAASNHRTLIWHDYSHIKQMGPFFSLLQLLDIQWGTSME